MVDLIKKLKGDKIEITKGMGAREKDRSAVINDYIDKLIKWIEDNLG